MPNIDRTAARNRLNKQRARLKAKGASPTEIEDYFGVKNSVKFGNLTDESLKSVIDHVNKQPTVTVKNGFIYPLRYIKAHQVWFGTSANMIQGYKGTLRSNLFKDGTLAETRKRRKEIDKRYKESVLNALEEIGLDDLAKKLKRLSMKDFNEFMGRAGGIVDPGELFSWTMSDGEMVEETQALDDYRERVTSLYNNFRRNR